MKSWRIKNSTRCIAENYPDLKTYNVKATPFTGNFWTLSDRLNCVPISYQKLFYCICTYVGGLPTATRGRLLHSNFHSLLPLNIVSFRSLFCIAFWYLQAPTSSRFPLFFFYQGLHLLTLCGILSVSILLICPYQNLFFLYFFTRGSCACILCLMWSLGGTLSIIDFLHDLLFSFCQFWTVFGLFHSKR